jgi:hypothetical protein
MDVNETDGRTREFRVILPVLGAPSPGNFLPSTLREFAEVFSEPQNPDFSVANLEFRNLGRSAYRPDCAVQFLLVVP